MLVVPKAFPVFPNFNSPAQHRVASHHCFLFSIALTAAVHEGRVPACLPVSSLLFLYWGERCLAPGRGVIDTCRVIERMERCLSKRGESRVLELCGVSPAMCAVGGMSTQRVCPWTGRGASTGQSPLPASWGSVFPPEQPTSSSIEFLCSLQHLRPLIRCRRKI